MALESCVQFRENYKQYLRAIFSILHLIIFGLTAGYIYAGQQILDHPFYHADMGKYLAGYTLELVFMSIFYLVSVVFGILTLTVKCRFMNYVIGFYAFAMLGLGCVFMAFTGSALAAFETVEINDIYQACDANTLEELEIIKQEKASGSLIVDYVDMANRFDEHHAGIINKVMCTEACPCWKPDKPNTARTEDGLNIYESDAYSMYKSLGDDYLKKFGRVFDKPTRRMLADEKESEADKATKKDEKATQKDEKATKKDEKATKLDKKGSEADQKDTKSDTKAKDKKVKEQTLKDLIPFVWTNDPKKGVESFLECYRKVTKDAGTVATKETKKDTKDAKKDGKKSEAPGVPSTGAGTSKKDPYVVFKLDKLKEGEKKILKDKSLQGEKADPSQAKDPKSEADPNAPKDADAKKDPNAEKAAEEAAPAAATPITKEKEDGEISTIEEIEEFQILEKKFNCAGMCQPALFYFDRNINQHNYPAETCLLHVKKYMGQSGTPLGAVMLLLAITSGLTFVFTLFMFQKAPEDMNSGQENNNVQMGNMQASGNAPRQNAYLEKNQNDGRAGSMGGINSERPSGGGVFYQDDKQQRANQQNQYNNNYNN